MWVQEIVGQVRVHRPHQTFWFKCVGSLYIPDVSLQGVSSLTNLDLHLKSWAWKINYYSFYFQFLTVFLKRSVDQNETWIPLEHRNLRNLASAYKCHKMNDISRQVVPCLFHRTSHSVSCIFHDWETQRWAESNSCLVPFMHTLSTSQDEIWCVETSQTEWPGIPLNEIFWKETIAALTHYWSYLKMVALECTHTFMNQFLSNLLHW